MSCIRPYYIDYSVLPFPTQYFLSLVTNSIFSLDLSIHQDALLLCGHLLAGTFYAAAKENLSSVSDNAVNGSSAPSAATAAAENLSSSSSSTPTSAASSNTASTLEETPKWKMLSDRNVVPLVEDLLAHVVKCLNVFVHILEGSTPGVSPPTTTSTRPSLPSMPTAASISSPIKRRR